MFLFSCELGSNSHFADPTRAEKVEFLLRYVFYVKDVNQLKVVALLPSSIKGRQRISLLQFSMDPRRIPTVLGDTLGEFRYFHPKDSVVVEIGGIAELIPDSSAKLLSKTERAMLMEIQAKVGSVLRYQPQTRDLPLQEALRQGRGDCTEFTKLALQYCQERGLEGRELAGIHWRQGLDPFHSWAECRRPQGPWVILDPTWAAELALAGDSIAIKGLRGIRNLEGSSWRLQIGNQAMMENGFRSVSFAKDQGEVTMKVSARISPII